MSNLSRRTPSVSTIFTHPAFGSTLQRVFDEFFEGSPGAGEREVVTQASWTPAVDIKETEDALVLNVELPGVKKDAIDISLEDGVLAVTGERSFVRDEKKENYHRVERQYGKFSRSFRLPTNVQGDKVTAKFRDGVLVLELPKAEEAKPRQIQIS